MKTMCLVGLAGITGLGISASGATVVAPNGVEDMEGDSQGIPLFGGTETRTQVIYSSQHFSLFPPEGAYLVELRFRIEGGLPDFSGTADLEIRMSTSSADPNRLSTILAENVGMDETVVLSRRTMPLSGTSKAGIEPNSFNVIVPLPNRFLYQPSHGNLLLETWVYGGANLSPLDWDSSVNDGVSVAGASLTSPTAAISSKGLPTEFVFVPVPEPETAFLGICGIVALIYLNRRKDVTAGRIN